MTDKYSLTVNMLDAFEHSYTMLVAFYVAARLFLALYYCILIFTVPMVRLSIFRCYLLNRQFVEGCELWSIAYRGESVSGLMFCRYEVRWYCNSSCL